MSEIVLFKVTIIINVRNEEKYIKDLLESIKVLDYPTEKIEIIIVDGGSTDNTVKIASRYPFVNIIESKCTLSQGKNIGIKNSIGDIVAFIEGDSTIDRNWVKNVVNYFNKYPDISAIGGPYLPGNQDEFFAKYLEVKAAEWFPIKTGITTRAMSLGGGNSAYRRYVFEQVGLFDENLGRGSKISGGEDIDFNLRLIDSGHKLFYAEDVIIYHKFRGNFKEISKYTYQSGVESSKYLKYSSNVIGIKKLLWNLLFPLFFIPFISIFLIALFYRAFFIGFFMIFLYLIYYIYKIVSFQRKYDRKMEAKIKYTKPIIDTYRLLLWSIGAFIGLIM